jgi:hypothetical protein
VSQDPIAVDVRPVHDGAVRIICSMRGYSENEVESLICESDDAYNVDVACEYATITSVLIDAYRCMCAGLQHGHSSFCREHGCGVAAAEST